MATRRKTPLPATFNIRTNLFFPGNTNLAKLGKEKFIIAYENFLVLYDDLSMVWKMCSEHPHMT